MFGEGERLDQIMSSLSQKTGLRYLQRLSVDPQNVGLSYVFPLSYRVRQLLNSKHTYEVYIYVYIIYSGIYVYIVLYNVWGILQSELNRLMFSLAAITGDHIKQDLYGTHYFILFSTSLLLSSLTHGSFFSPQGASGQAVVTPFSPPGTCLYFLSLIGFIQHSHCSSIFIHSSSLTLSRFPLIILYIKQYSIEQGFPVKKESRGDRRPAKRKSSRGYAAKLYQGT